VVHHGAVSSPDAPVLRPYQREAVEAVLSARRRGVRRMLVCLPTGAGKTVVFASLARLARRPVLVLAHRGELLTQARDKLRRELGHAVRVDIEQGPLRAAPEARVVVCSIRSLHPQRLARLMEGRAPGLVIYDECHHAAAADNRRVLTALGCFEKAWEGTLVGFTATTARGDGQGLDTVFEEIVYARTLPEMIADGYLVPLRGFRVATGADLTRITARGTDLPEDELAEAVDIEARNALVARSIQELARDRRTIVFCVTVAHARHLQRSLDAVGVRAGVVHGAMNGAARAEMLSRYAAGKLQALCNVAVLTEGFDDPGVSCVAMARPTRSEGLYAQCVGRGTRLHPGKRDCLVLDFVDVSSLSLVTLPSLFGMPRELDLDGRDVREARRVFEQLLLDYPGFEAEAGAITLEEIQARAAAFDPLTQTVDADVRAISRHAWASLGKMGVVLHFERAPGHPSEALVLCRGERGKRWEVRLDGTVKARFSSLEQAVAAVDYEIERCGRHAVLSALPDAPWRAQRVPPERAAAAARTRLRMGAATTLAHALLLESWARVRSNG